MIANKIEWNEEDQCYVGTVPSMPGCISTGDTIEEAMADLERAKLEWMDEDRRIKEAGR